ncbi:MAG TPA: hypothetical protein VD948_09695 [Rhodothermales bacterium]|nr:hypothetical protein [Rhodothermales bacterium]
MPRTLLFLLLGLAPVAALAQEPPEVAPTAFYRRSSLGVEYVKRDYVEGDKGTGFSVNFYAEPLAYRAPLGNGVAWGGLVAGGLGFGAVRRMVDETEKAFVVRRYEATALAGLEMPLGDAARAGAFLGYSAQGIITTFPRQGALARLRINTVPVRFEANALLTGRQEGSLHLLVPIPTGDLIRGSLAFGFSAARYEDPKSGIVRLFGFSINASDF